MANPPTREEAEVALRSLRLAIGQSARDALDDFLAVEARLLRVEPRLAQADRAVVEFGHRMGWATGHGDTIVDMLEEFEGQARRERDTVTALNVIASEDEPTRTHPPHPIDLAVRTLAEAKELLGVFEDHGGHDGMRGEAYRATLDHIDAASKALTESATWTRTPPTEPGWEGRLWIDGQQNPLLIATTEHWQTKRLLWVSTPDVKFAEVGKTEGWWRAVPKPPPPPERASR